MTNTVFQVGERVRITNGHCGVITEIKLNDRTSKIEYLVHFTGTSNLPDLYYEQHELSLRQSTVLFVGHKVNVIDGFNNGRSGTITEVKIRDGREYCYIYCDETKHSFWCSKLEVAVIDLPKQSPEVKSTLVITENKLRI